MINEAAKYKYPFPTGTEIKIVKPTGEYAHENFPESKYAVDLLVDVGTPVCAARGGTIWKIKQDSDQWGLDTKFATEANLVAIDHGDGTFAEYIHLGKDTVPHKEGDAVETGEVIGCTGLSGCMDVPHLHFNVFVIKDGKGVSTPFEWSTVQ